MTRPKLKISAETAAEDLRSGMSDSDMMQKYRLSPKGLVSLFKKLLEAGIVDQGEIDRRMNALETTIELDIDKFPFEIAQDTVRGKLKWSFKTGGWVFSSPVLWSGAVYFGSWDGNLYCLDLKTGHSKWTFKAVDVVRSSPVIWDDIVYVGSWDHHIYAVNAVTGMQIWTFKTGQEVWSSPAVSDGIVYIGSTDGILYAVDARQGRLKWRFKSQGLAFNWVESSPVVADGTVYFGTHGGDLYAVHSQTGEEMWRFTAGDSIDSSPTVSEGLILFGSNDSNLYAVDIKTRQERWRFKTANAVSRRDGPYDRVFLPHSPRRKAWLPDCRISGRIASPAPILRVRPRSRAANLRWRRYARVLRSGPAMAPKAPPSRSNFCTSASRSARNFPILSRSITSELEPFVG